MQDDTPPGPRHVTLARAGDRLDRALAEALGDISRSRLKVLILDGRVARAGTVVRTPDARVAAGEAWTINLPAPVAARPAAQAMDLAIVFEDEHLLVLDKPAGLVVHPAPGNPDRTLVNALIAHCGDSLAGIGGERRPGIVHRLDKDTSGLMAVAKTQQALDSLSRQFATRTAGREYAALVWGLPLPPAGEIEGAIGRDPRHRNRMAVVEVGGRAALTRYAVERRYGPPVRPLASLLACRLATGRTHQIRVHLAWRGHPVIGDPVYGGRAAGGRTAALPEPARLAVAALGRQALHARKLALDHPASGERMAFSAPLPQILRRLIDTLESIKYLP
ncbi:MAG: RluA family pseudouridine synthase [Alphaproteobacteria bacterium]|nr:RluA family pseudouridine synthase [Alphaproteobacteria bacterium]